MERHDDFTQDPTFAQGVKDEQQLWDEILRQHGLSMSAGVIDVVHYGPETQTSLRPVFNYTKPVTNGRQRNLNGHTAKKIIALVKSGLTIYGAAKKLQMAPTHAYRCLARYRKNLPVDPTFAQGEGS